MVVVLVVGVEGKQKKCGGGGRVYTVSLVTKVCCNKSGMEDRWRDDVGWMWRRKNKNKK